jgi:pimeloyl-ACP methyl ester carboxylesterase/DNA-binding winged helix-turn-helix (wHTH) protein
MLFVFGEYELDPERRELRLGGEPRPVQPQVLALLLYLVSRRDRAVGKRELLEALWPNVRVTSGSLQRAVSLARDALAPEGRRWIRTFPRYGYRFVGPVEEPEAGPEPARPRYVRSGDVHIAYRVLGEGPVDIAVVFGWAFPMSAALELPELKRELTALARLGRTILFDKRGTGLSDRVKQLPGLEQRIDDLRAVLDAAGSRQAVVVGLSEGGPLAILYAATHPERTRGLVLAGAFARMTRAPDYPWGWSPAEVTRLREYIQSSWGAGETILAPIPSRRENAGVRAWAARAEQAGASPGSALDLLAMNLEIDVRPVLPSVSTPTIVIHHSEDAVIPVGNGRYLAQKLREARYHEAPGPDHVFCCDEPDPLVEAVGRLIGAAQPPPPAGFLATVVVVLPEAPLAPASAERAEETIGRFKGQVVDGDGITAHFDGPVRALTCARELVETLGSAGPPPRVGVDASEVARAGKRVVGPAVSVAAELAREARQGQVLLTRVVADLVPGSGLELEGLAGTTSGGGQIFALARLPT